MESLKKQAAKLLGEQKKYRRWLAVFLCMAIAVTAGTTAALKMNGQALSHKQKVLDCGLEVHEHTAECYESGAMPVEEAEGEAPVCGFADYVVHVHNDDCYGGDGELVCQLEQAEPHIHDESCYTEQLVLMCGLEENPGHQHTEECRALICGEEESETVQSHQHTEECRALVCGMEETEGHQHTDSCRSIQDELICESAEEGHEHTENCYQQVETITCGMEEAEGHTHTEACYDAHACGLEETTEGHVHTESCYDPYACGTEEGAEGHAHTDECYLAVQILTCGKLELHTHVTEGEGSCYDAEGSLICGIPELKEHVHGEDCFVTEELTKEEVEAMQGGEGTAEDAGDSKVERTIYQKSFENEFIKIIAEYDETAGIPVEAELFVEQVSGTAKETDIDGVTDTAVTTESVPEGGEASEGGETEPGTAGNEAGTEPETGAPADTDAGNGSGAEAGAGDVPEAEPEMETDAGETPEETEEGTLQPTSEDVTVPGADTGEDTQPVTESGADAAQAEGNDAAQTEGNDGAIDAGQSGEGAEVPSENEEDTAEPSADAEGTEDLVLQGKGRIEIVPEEVTYRIGFRLNGEEIEPQGSVTFTVWNLEEEESEPQTIACSGGSSDRTVTLARMVEVFVRTEFQKEYEDGSIRVIAEYGEAAEIPEEAELRVRKITEESDPDHFAKREEEFKEQIGDENATMDILLNIGFFDGDKEIEPKDTVTITLQFLDSEGIAVGAPIDMVHFAEKGAEVLEASVLDETGTTTFQTDSFSDFGASTRNSYYGIPVYVSRNGEWEIVGGVEGWDVFSTDSEKNFINPYTCVESLRLYSYSDSNQLRNSAQNSENGIAPEKWIGYSTSSEVGKGITTVDCKVLTFDNYGSETSPVWIFGDVFKDIKAIYYLPGNMKEYDEADVPATLFSGNGYKVIFNPGNVGGDRPLTSYGSITPVTVNIPMSAVDKEGYASIRLPDDSKLGEPFSFTENSEWQYTIGRESGYNYKLVGWYNITDETYYSVENTGNGYKEVRIKVAEGDESRKVQFYGDWIAASYNVPDDRKAAAVNDSDGGKTEDISDFVSTRVFDYNELFNVYSARFIEDGNTWEIYPGGKFHQDRNMSAGSLKDDAGHTLELEEVGSLNFPFIQSVPDSNKNALIRPSSIGAYPHDQVTETGFQGIAGTNKQGNILLQYLFPDEGSLDGVLGVHYVGEGNYLYRHFGSDEEHIGYYEFNSENNTALYDRTDQRFFILPGERALGGTAFLPFNYGGGLTTDSPSVNYHFGICSEIDFYLPSKPGTEYKDSQGNTKYGNLIDEDIAAGKDGRMLFEFSGDDDVWVFVDDVLILDLGGIHGKINGSIDFSEGTVTDAGGMNAEKSTLLKNIEAGNHKLTIYYLERGGGQSNCRIKFNIVPRYRLELPTANTVTVKKVWEDLGNDIKHDEDSVTVGLYTKNDETLVGKKEILNKANDWSYTWKALAPDMEYIVKEDPKDGYKSSSKVETTSEYKYWAETDTLWDEKALTDDEKTIVILNRDNDAKAFVGDGSVKNITVTQGVILSELTDDIKWRVIPAEGGYYLQNVESKNYLHIDSSGVNTSGSPQVFNLDSDAKIRLCTNDYKLVYADGGFHSYAKSGNNETNSSAENITVRVFRYHAVSSFVKNYTITNTYLPEIAIWKVDSETEAELGSATFTLTRTYEEKITEEIKDKDGNLQNIEKSIYKWGYYTAGRKWVDSEAKTLEQAKEYAAKVQEEVTFSGKLRLEKLSDGDYVLTEKKAPDGYLVPEGELARIEFSVVGGQITKVSQNLIGQKVSGENASVPKKIAEVKEGTDNKILLVRNEKLPVTTARIMLLKYGKGKGDSTPLGGASFNLYRVLTEEEIKDAESKAEKIETIKPGETELKVRRITEGMQSESLSEAKPEKGLFFDGMLPCGTYYLEETKVPAGYNIIAGMVKFEIKDEKGTLSVTTENSLQDVVSRPETGFDADGTFFKIKVFNTQSYELPETGSLGTKPFTIGGAMLITATAILMYGYSVRRRKSERRLKK